MAETFAFIEKLSCRLGGFTPLLFIAAVGLLIWFLIYAIAYVQIWLRDAFSWAKDVWWRWRIERMPKEKLVRMAVENKEGYVREVLNQLEDTPECILQVSEIAKGYPAWLAAERYCALMGHDWDHCVCRRCHKQRDEEHNWAFCRCETCGETRDAEHDWNGCQCRVCGKTRDEEHDWDGCICGVCGKTRDEEHVWDGCKCRACGKTRDAAHDWDGCKCRVCGKTRDEEHSWVGIRCTRCGAIMPHEHVWKFAYTEYEASDACAQCNKPQPGGVEDWCGDFCFGPNACQMGIRHDFDRCELCGAVCEEP